jgi:hypothetical protein
VFSTQQGEIFAAQGKQRRRSNACEDKPSFLFEPAIDSDTSLRELNRAMTKITPGDLNRINAEFWEVESKNLEERMKDPVLREAAYARLRSERMRGVCVKKQMTLDGALAAEEQTALRSADHIEARVVSSRARRAGSAEKVDALQSFINSVVEKRPKITGPELLDKIRAEVGSGGPIVDLDKTCIWFVGAHDQLRSTTKRGLKDRLSRAKKKMKSKD